MVCQGCSCAIHKYTKLLVQQPHIQLDFIDTSVPQLPEAYAVIQPVEYLSSGFHVTCISIEFMTIS